MDVNQTVTGNERPLVEGKTLVSRTDTEGRITWVNRDFLDVSGYTERQLIGEPHSIVRHPDVPPVLFENLWSCLRSGQPWISVIKNRCRNGDHFWVEAQIAPTFDGGTITGYESVFRKPPPARIAETESLYAKLRGRGSRYVIHRGLIEPRSLLKEWNPLWHLALRIRLQLLALVSGGLASLVALAMQHQVSQHWIWGLIAAGTTFSCYSADWLSRDFGGRLRKAVSTFHHIAAGDYHNTVDISRNDEVGGVLLGLQSMQVQLGASVEELQRAAIEMRRIHRGLDAAATAVLLTDERLQIIFANIALQKLFERVENDLRKELPGFDAQALIGSSLGEFFRDVAADPLKGLGTRKEILSQELRLGGHVFNLLLTPVDAVDGARIGYAVEWRDRTDAVAVEAEINAVVKAAAEGDFSRRIELHKSATNTFFVDLVDGFNRVLDINTRALENIVAVLDALANGDLKRSFDGQYRGTLAKVQEDVNRTLRQLNSIVGRIKRASSVIGEAAVQIASGNAQLSERSEREATNLAETAANLERLTTTVKQNAEHARQARQLAGNARDIAERGGKAVGDVETTMSAIHRLSQKIADITGVIDGIAFQTNILALNSAVEAARAGEHGRGFAVVASEVRSLAQRAAAAAKEIKQLIGTSVEQINNGSQLVDGAGNTMREIIGSVREVEQIMAAIAAASQDQSSGIAQVNAAVAQNGSVTRENASLVVNATASARSLEREAAELGEAVSIFKTADSPGPAAARNRPARNSGPVHF